MNQRSRNDEADNCYDSHHIQLFVAREMQGTEEAAQARNEAANLNDTVADKQSRDGCSHSETQGDDARNTAESIHFWQDQFQGQDAAAYEAEHDAEASAEHTECSPDIADGLAYKCRWNGFFLLVNDSVAYIAHQPHDGPQGISGWSAVIGPQIGNN